MKFQVIQPSARLAPFVKSYWTMEAGEVGNDISERVIPTGNVELMFHYKNSFRVKRKDSCTFNQAQSFIGGLSNSYSDVCTRGETGMVCITFLPAGACRFFSFPLSEIENQHVALDLICRNESKKLEEQLSESATMKERIALVEQFLFDRINLNPAPDFLFIQAGIQLIEQSKGQIGSAKLADKLSVTPKTLERKFSVLVGKTPKQYSKIVRFQGILNSFSSRHFSNFTQIAYENGYFDQAHFINDFKSFTGYTPKDFLTIYPCNPDCST